MNNTIDNPPELPAPKAAYVFVPDMTKDHYVCCSCELRHRYVECAGIYYCPNPLCLACGATCHKRDLKTYRDLPNRRAECDPLEVVSWGQDLIRQQEDLDIRAAMERSMDYWLKLAGPRLAAEVLDC